MFQPVRNQVQEVSRACTASHRTDPSKRRVYEPHEQLTTGKGKSASAAKLERSRKSAKPTNAQNRHALMAGSTDSKICRQDIRR
jgi:hypothetical protein